MLGHCHTYYRAWLKEFESESMRNPTIKHFVNKGRSIKTDSALKPSTKQVKAHHTVCSCFLSFPEAFAMHLEKL